MLENPQLVDDPTYQLPDASVTSPPPSHQQLVAQLLDTLTLVPDPEAAGSLIGQSHDYVGSRVFGGQVLGQALMAASHSVASERHCHSLHGYFLRGGDIRKPVHYEVTAIRDGRSLSARQITARQQDDKLAWQTIFVMLASFSSQEAGLDYQDTMPDYPPPEDLLSEQQLKQRYLPKIPKQLHARYLRPREIEIRPVKPRDPITPEPVAPRQANWLRIPELGKQPAAVQQALLAFASDYYLLGTGLMPHGISFFSKGLQIASIDHSMHFHRPFDLNDWILYEMHSDTTANVRGLTHGRFWQHGKLIASTRQEGLIRLQDD